MGDMGMPCKNCGNQSGNGQFCQSCGRSMDEHASETLVAEPRTQPDLDAVGGLLRESVQVPVAVGAVPVGVGSLVQTPTTPVLANATNVTVNVGGPQIMYQDSTGPGLLVRGLWFVCFGWYAGFAWITMAAILNLTVVGLPLGITMFNALPKVMTLKSRSAQLGMTVNADGTYSLTKKHVDQRPFWMRALYFLFVGFWFSIAWAYAAYAIGLFIVTLPVSFLMFDRMPAVTTLARY